MPRPGPRREGRNVRFSATDLEWLEAEAKRLDVTASDVVRAAVGAWQRLPEPQRTF